jgi:predicted RNA-binding protein with PIN domain
MRAREAEQELRDLRREVRRREQERQERGGLDASELRLLADAAGEAQRLATRLEGLTRITRHAPTGADPEPGPTSGRAPTTRRVPVPCPGGLVADTADGLDAMLRTRGVQLVVDGYNVSMAGRADAPIAEQRDWLLGGLTRLHLRLRCEIAVIFDGADVDTEPPRRAGVKVVYSSGGEKADPVVVREVALLPASTPAIVVSSDRWVREHAEAEGAIAVPAEALVDLLRR